MSRYKKLTQTAMASMVASVDKKIANLKAKRERIVEHCTHKAPGGKKIMMYASCVVPGGRWYECPVCQEVIVKL